MEKLHQEIFIKAPREKVWDVMLSDKTYREWTKAFHEGSYFKGRWEKGSKMLFIGPDDQGGEMGMVSRIAQSKKPEFVSIEHLGIYKNGVEDTTSPEAKKWSPAFENYTFKEKDGGTELHVDMDIDKENREMFESMWKEAFKLLKALAEK